MFSAFLLFLGNVAAQNGLNLVLKFCLVFLAQQVAMRPVENVVSASFVQAEAQLLHEFHVNEPTTD